MYTLVPANETYRMHPFRWLAAAALILSYGCETPSISGSYGDPCSGSGCSDGLQCVSDARFPGGYCSAICTDRECDDGADCDSSLGLDLCLARCAGPADCREGYQCWSGHCRPLCGTDGDCGAGGSCGGDGTCSGAECAVGGDCAPTQSCVMGRCVETEGDGGTLLAPGTACTQDVQCASGVCLPADLGGFCAATCTSRDECFVYPVAATCSALPRDTDGNGSPDAAPTVCLPLPDPASPIGSACTEDAQCSARICHEGQCTEVCAREDECLTGQLCRSLVREGTGGATYQGCGYTDRVGSVMIESQVLRESDLMVGFVGLYDRALPPDAVSVTFQGQRLSGDPLSMIFGSVTDPSETTIFDIGEIFELRDQPIRWLPDDGPSSTMLVPNTSPDRVAFMDGVYDWTAGPQARFDGDTGTARFRMTALIKRTAGGALVGGTLDLNVFLVGIGLTASTAPTNSKMVSALSRLETILQPANVRLGTVAFFDVSSAEASTFGVVDDETELADLFRLSAGRSGLAINIFLVRDIGTGVGGGSTLGVAGGVPGPVGIHGTQDSGVVVGYEMPQARTVGHVLAHEIGHYIGLFHATEQARACGAGEIPSEDDCAPFGAQDTLVDTGYGDQDNLMYWSFVSASQHELSTGQRNVFRVSPLVGE